MNKKEILEQFEEEIYKMIDARNGISTEIYQIISKTLDRMFQLYKDSGCDNISIEDYISAAKGEFKKILEKEDNERRNVEFKEFRSIAYKIRLSIEENNNYIEQSCIEDTNFQEINFEDRKTSENISSRLLDTLKDIQLQQNRFLYSQGYSESRLDEINDLINSYIYKAMQRDEEEIYEKIKEDSNQLVLEIEKKYEDYIKNTEKMEDIQEEKSVNKGQSKREEFLQRLDSGFSLQEQKRFVEDIKKDEDKQQSNTAKELPIHVID